METQQFSRSLCVAVDVEGYSSRIEVDQARVQADLRHLVFDSGRREGLATDAWKDQEQGDGYLILAPLDGTEPRYVDGFVRQMVAQLARLNHGRLTDAHLRVRVALHHGVAYPGESGFVGDAAILACRLRDADACRQALVERDTDLVLILSSATYHDVVAAGHTPLDPAEFTRVSIDERKVRETAWIWSPRDGGRVSPSTTVKRGKKDGRSRRRGEQSAATINNVDLVQADYVHFGTQVGRGRR